MIANERAIVMRLFVLCHQKFCGMEKTSYFSNAK